MGRQIIFYEDHFMDFYTRQDKKVQEKIQYVFQLIQSVEKVPEKFLKHLTGTDGLYEIRVEYRSDIFRSSAVLIRERLLFCSTVSRRKRKRPLPEK